MKNLQIYCISMEPAHLNFIKELGYIPVGLGDKNFSDDWMRDNTGDNISHKNKFYSECTFHYWIWKNYLDKLGEGWVGFCQYRKFWSFKKQENKIMNIEAVKTQILKEIPTEYEKYESILTVPQFVNQWKPSKFIKKGLKIFFKKPYLLLNKKKRNISFHFDLMHGENILNKAIELLDDKNKKDFKEFVNREVSFNAHIMVICKSKKKLQNYYEDLFPWLKRCEKIFGFENLEGYGKTRIYGFLSERFMSYWFQKNTKYTTMPILFYDIRNDIK